MLGRAAARQTHRQTQAFANDGAFEENVVSIVADFARNDLIRERFDTPVGRPLRVVSHAGYFAENTAADLLDAGLYASHSLYPPCFESFGF